MATRIWYVYIVRCADGRLYTGVTTDIARRLAEHNAAAGRGARYTRRRRPVRVVYHEALGSRSAALRREHAIRRLAKPAKERLVAGGA